MEITETLEILRNSNRTQVHARTGGAAPARYNVLGLKNAVVMRVENKIHIVNVAC